MRETRGPGRPPTIVLADDDAEALDVLSRLLIAAGYRCLPSPGGAAAYRVLLQAQPDLLITDLHMPCGDGYSLIERARRETDIPILAITGRSVTHARERLSATDEHIHLLAKPFGRREFLDLVRQLMGPDSASLDGSGAPICAAG